eukprot:2752768-Alexandrium_andersonii.AAC.1
MSNKHIRQPYPHEQQPAGQQLEHPGHLQREGMGKPELQQLQEQPEAEDQQAQPGSRNSRN